MAYFWENVKAAQQLEEHFWVDEAQVMCKNYSS
jgi:hypothetical protein